jgi:hypothetical protein
MMMLSILLYHKTACEASKKGPSAGFRDIYPVLRRAVPQIAVEIFRDIG